MGELYIKLESKSWLRDIKSLDKDLVSVNDLISAIEDLYDENGVLKEQLENLKQDVEDNYELKNTDPYDYYGVSKKDFE